MHIGQACAAIAAARKNICPQAPLVATMSAQFAFDALGETERRIDSVPLMGGAAGLGLGLALAQRLAQGMGGQVGVDNHAPHGCTFWVSVPVPDGPPAPSDRKSGID